MVLAAGWEVTTQSAAEAVFPQQTSTQAVWTADQVAAALLTLQAAQAAQAHRDKVTTAALEQSARITTQAAAAEPLPQDQTEAAQQAALVALVLLHP